MERIKTKWSSIVNSLYKHTRKIKCRIKSQAWSELKYKHKINLNKIESESHKVSD